MALRNTHTQQPDAPRPRREIPLPLRKSAQKLREAAEPAEGREPSSVQMPESGASIGLRFGKKPMVAAVVETRYEGPKPFAELKKWLKALRNPAIMLALLVVVTLGMKLLRSDFSLAGRAGLAAVFLFTAFGHFLKTDELRRMMPRRIPYRRMIVMIAGTAELLLVPLLLFQPEKAGWAVIAFLLAGLPAAFYAAVKRVAHGGYELGPLFLLVRVPLQLLLIGWAWWFCLRG